jgi:F0F1-type ATP synthase epsilon subunit
MKAGVLQIIHTDSPEPEKYFVPGGFALSHENSVTDITCPEAVKLDDIDSAAVTSNFNEAKRVYDGSEEGSEAKALAQIDMDVNRAMAQALGVTIA